MKNAISIALAFIMFQLPISNSFAQVKNNEVQSLSDSLYDQAQSIVGQDLDKARQTEILSSMQSSLNALSPENEISLIDSLLGRLKDISRENYSMGFYMTSILPVVILLSGLMACADNICSGKGTLIFVGADLAVIAGLTVTGHTLNDRLDKKISDIRNSLMNLRTAQQLKISASKL